MNTIDLTDQETTTLRDVVENYLSDLHTEISHTDDRDFRGALRRRQELLQGVLERIAPLAAQPG